MNALLAVLIMSLPPAVHVQKAATETPSQEMVDAAADLAGRFATAWRAADGAAYGDAYWPEAELVDPTGRVFDGRDAIIETHRDLWAQGKSTARTKVRRVRRLSDHLILVDITTTVCGFTRLPPGARADEQGCVWSNLKHVAEKRGANWKILASQNTFSAPPR